VRFDTTNWSVVTRASSGDPARARAALATLCQAYWYPIYAFIRGRGEAAADAEDLTQAYFTRFLEKDCLKDVRPEHGRFRSFLLVSVRNFVLNEHERERARKRGGGRPHLSLDAAAGEARYAVEPRDATTPETLFERSWARTVLDRVFGRLREEARGGAEGGRYDRLEPFLTGDATADTCASLAREWGLGPSTVRVAVHRLRRRFGEILREEIGQTVARPADVEDEVRHLLRIVGG
jgi:RNA polymerase sigma-70 factor (ECF subfamily)